MAENILGEDPRVGRALTAIERGQQAQVVLRYLEEYLLGRQQQLDTELFGAAETDWHGIVRQKIEAHKFMVNLSALLQGGASAGRILGPLLERNNAQQGR